MFGKVTYLVGFWVLILFMSFLFVDSIITAVTYDTESQIVIMCRDIVGEEECPEGIICGEDNMLEKVNSLSGEDWTYRGNLSSNTADCGYTYWTK